MLSASSRSSPEGPDVRTRHHGTCSLRSVPARVRHSHEGAHRTVWPEIEPLRNSRIRSVAHLAHTARGTLAAPHSSQTSVPRSRVDLGGCLALAESQTHELPVIENEGHPRRNTIGVPKPRAMVAVSFADTCPEPTGRAGCRLARDVRGVCRGTLASHNRFAPLELLTRTLGPSARMGMEA